MDCTRNYILRITCLSLYEFFHQIRHSQLKHLGLPASLPQDNKPWGEGVGVQVKK